MSEDVGRPVKPHASGGFDPEVARAYGRMGLTVYLLACLATGQRPSHPWLDD